MFNSGILDVVIGLVVVYLQLSLVVTAVNEFIAGALKARARELEKGIAQLLTSPQLVEKFYSHPLIQGLRPEGKRPSYIPSETFALTLMDIVRRHSFDGTLAAASGMVQKLQDAQAAAQNTFQTTSAALGAAKVVRDAADAALAGLGANASAADRLEAAKTAQEALNQHAAADVANNDALLKFQASLQALVDSINNQELLKINVENAKQAEDTAIAAENAAAKDATQQDAARRARKAANEAAALITPSSASLLSEARDKLVGVPENVVPPELKSALLALLDNAGTNLAKAQTNIEQWFNDAMDRVSGVYKRKSQYVIVIIAMLVTLAANVDSMQIADSLSHDKAVRESLVAAAPELAKADRMAVEAERNQPIPPPQPSPSPGSAASQGTPPAPSATPVPSATPASISTLKDSLDQLKTFGVPIGYVRVCTAGEEKVVDACPNAIDAFYQAKANLTIAITNTQKARAAQESAAKDKPGPQALAKTLAEQDAAQSQYDKAHDLMTATKQWDDELLKKYEKFEEEDSKLKQSTAALDAARAPLDAAKRALDAATAEANKNEKGASKQTAKDDAQKKVSDAQEKFDEAKKQVDADSANTEAARNAFNAKRAKLKERVRSKCPRCTKAADLSPNELKQRLPTTHDHEIFGSMFENGFHLTGDLLSSDAWPAVLALFFDSMNLLYSHWLGWLLTTFAISLGAPFWFDTLNRLMVIRSTVKPEEKSGTQKSKDNPEGDGGSDGAKKPG